MPFTLPKLSWSNDERIERFPDRVPLDLEVTSRRTQVGYEEWRIIYTAEDSAGMREPTLARIPAYLLIPNDGRFSPPYPGMVCFHQCGRDCDIGKEAVVGKATQRADQAYGLELVQQGFVVIAPDSINCAERIIPALRTAGAHPRTWNHSRCWGALKPFVPWGSPRAKKVWDGIRTIDALESFPFVDRTRIGTIGHSMGSGTALETLICDQRLRVAILSAGGCSERDRDLAAPRLIIQQQGIFDTTMEDLAAVESAQRAIRAAYARAGADPDLVVHRVVAAGHHFHDEFKWPAYRRLKEHFGMIPPQRPVGVLSALRGALARLERREDLWWSWPRRRPKGRLPEISGTRLDDRSATGDDQQVELAFEALVTVLMQKVETHLALAWGDDAPAQTHRLLCLLPGQAGNPIVAHEHLLRDASMRFADNGTVVRWATHPAGLTCIVDLPASLGE